MARRGRGQSRLDDSGRPDNHETREPSVRIVPCGLSWTIPVRGDDHETHVCQSPRGIPHEHACACGVLRHESCAL